MSLRVLAGKYKGREIKAPTKGVRPTSVLLRRRVFDSAQDISDRIFIDLCAGSGMMGIEALSRGALSIKLLDIAKSSIDHINRNLMHLGVEKSLSEVIKADALKWIKKSKEMDFSKTIIFFDPPYQMENLYEEFISLVLAKEVRGEIWIELGLKEKFSQKIMNQLEDLVTKEIIQGDRCILKLYVN